MKTLKEVQQEKDGMYIRGLLHGLVIAQNDDKEYRKEWLEIVEEEYSQLETGEAALTEEGE